MKRLFDLIKYLALRFDRYFGTKIKESGGRIYRLILRFLSPIRRITDPLFVRFCYITGICKARALKLHIGCGWKHFEGYINIDLWITDATDLICDVTRLPWPENVVEVIESYHVIEHISHRRIREALMDWHRVLIPGGRLILECPHFDKAVSEYLSGNVARLINIFGRQRSYGDAHLYGYTPQRLSLLLKDIGFVNIQESPPQSSQSLDEPSFRIECTKKT
jgi:SAM-dependent methyltransferase